MIEAYAKPLYQKLCLDSALRLGVIRRATPNFLTMISLLCGLCVMPALYFAKPLLATLLLLTSGYLDSLDGALARASDNSSSLGTVFDIMADRTVECAVVLGLFLVAPDARGLLCLVMLASMLICISSFLVVGIFTPNNSEKSFHYSPGLMERPEAFVFFIAMMWLPAYFSLLAATFAILVFYTGVNRIREFARQST